MPYADKNKQRIYNIARIAEHRIRIKRKAVAYFGGSCICCGYNNCVDALQFHHIDPSIKSLRISSGSTRSWVKIKEELDKCILLCANCHAEHHAGLLPISNKMIEIADTNRRNFKDVPLEHFRIDQENRKQEKQLLKCDVCGDDTYTKYCSQKCSQIGKQRIKWPDDLLEQSTKTPILRIAKRLGISETAVRKKIKRLKNISKYQTKFR